MNWRNHSKSLGISLVEVLIVISVLGVIAALAVPAVHNVHSSSKSAKLAADVKTLNSAIQIYVANGGKFETTDTAADVIQKLKGRMSDAEAKKFVGFTGSMLDHRIEPVWLADDKIEGGSERAVWDADEGEFVISREGVAGIGSFQLNENLGGGDEEESGERSSTMEYASETNWVWDYVEANPTLPGGPSVIPTNPIPPGSTPPSTTSTGGPVPPSTSKLSPPSFSISPGAYPIGNYRLAVQLLDSNAGGTSQVYFRRNGGNWSSYATGTDLIVMPDDTLDAYALPNDSSQYEASDLAQGGYRANPAQLQLAANPDGNSFTYYDLVDNEPKIDLRVTNLSDFPDFLRTSGMFATYWTSDSSDPTAGADRVLASVYSPGYSGDLVSIYPDMWANDPVMEFKAYAQPTNSPYILGSAVQTVSLTATPIELSPATISVEETSPNEYLVMIEAPEGNPPGTQVYYNLGGDPPYFDEAEGVVKGGQPYAGPFVYKPDLTDGGDEVDVTNKNNDVSISQVVLHSKGKDIVQDESYYFNELDDPGYDGGRDNEVVDRSNDRIELKSITIVQDGKTIVADNVNVLSVSVSNFNIPSGASDDDIQVKQSGSVVADLGDFYGGKLNKFKNALQNTLSSTNLRDYIDYSSRSKSSLSGSDFDYDVSFSPVTNNDFLVVMERYGNSTFDLRPLDANGDPISGGNRLVFREYSWNTGHAPSDTGGQSFFFSVIDIEKFGVDTDINSISGFRVNNDGGADFKFFTISSESFEDREVRYVENVQVRVFPPTDLGIWFTPSTISTKEISGTATAP